MDAFRITRRDDGVAMVIFDRPGETVNTISLALLEEFEARVTPLFDDRDVRALVVASGKSDSFIAGADLRVLDAMHTAAEAEELSRRGNAILSRVAASGKPVVAAIHGAALGGGLEVALACHFLLASDDPATVLGLPEVTFGLVPGGGGTQRLARRVGLAAALPLLLTGGRVRSRKALRLGLVDALTTPGGIAETAARVARKLADGTLRPQRGPKVTTRLAARAPMRRFVLRAARAEVLRKTGGIHPAPLAILECVEEGFAHGLARGLACESRFFGELVASRQSKCLVGMFHAMNELKKPAPGPAPRPIRRLGILGAGFMGSGIASVSLARCPVVVRDVADDALARCAASMDDGLEKQLRSGAISRTERDRRSSRLLLTPDLDDLRGADLVIEAVFEELQLKRDVLAEVEDLLSADAVFASNTSALPISSIASAARHPECVLGMHYFSPVPKMPLLELVVAEKTAPWAVATARAFAVAQGKTVITVKDRAGFYTTRILATYLNEAMLLLEEGARVEEVDAALKGFGFPVGPIALIDEVGIDVAAHVARDLAEAFASREAGTSAALARMAAAGCQGRKNRRGFYLYPRPASNGRKRPNPRVYALLGGAPRKPIAAPEIQDRLALVMVNESLACLEEGVVASPRDGDVGAVLGLGFPAPRGGPFRHVDEVGPATIVARLEQLAEQYGKRFAPPASLHDMAHRGERFYPDR
jgi:3-hydroxyacyl-CoA dehydrogenase / enoyl-CoA hydratase / 3-hydroxybutyryl-CoA epimerase